MSYAPVPAGGIEPPRDGATTRCLPTWPSRRNLVAEAGIEPAADGAYETPALPTELFRDARVGRGRWAGTMACLAQAMGGLAIIFHPVLCVEAPVMVFTSSPNQSDSVSGDAASLCNRRGARSSKL